MFNYQFTLSSQYIYLSIKPKKNYFFGCVINSHSNIVKVYFPFATPAGFAYFTNCTSQQIIWFAPHLHKIIDSYHKFVL